ncbi:hypothetical protein GCM10009861_01910 [Neomicrococcus aestuarii]|uniref:terminase large subunit domain-containing protein n=1 Tax=Neomicrococcus aestuarii TaxID=556325 RepID=UPI0031DD108D
MLPSGIVATDWPIVEYNLDRMGTPLDKWQQGLCMSIVAKREDGLYACGIGGAVASIPRQSGKTHTIGALIFALCLGNPGLLVLWSAHRSRTHSETFRTMGSMAKRQKIAPFIERVLTGAGTEAVEFKNGSRILFGAREHGFGRGIPKVDILVLDEAQILTEKAMEDMVPATNAAPNGLVILMGTPPRPSDPGEVFMNRRAAALSGEDEDILYVEFSADEKANPNDRKQWAIANPSFPHRTTETAILRMKKLLGSEDSFKREALGIWDETSLTRKAVNFDKWAACSISSTDVPRDGIRVFAVKFSIDGSAIGLAAATRPANGPVHVEAIKQAPSSNGTAWLIDWLVERKESTAQIVIEGKSGVGYLVNALRTEGIPESVIKTPSADEAIAAHGMFESAITDNGITHISQKALDDQIKPAVKRKIGNNGGFGWASPDGGTVVLFDAVTFAFWGAKTTTRNPRRKAVFL